MIWTTRDCEILSTQAMLACFTKVITCRGGKTNFRCENLELLQCRTIFFLMTFFFRVSKSSTKKKNNPEYTQHCSDHFLIRMKTLPKGNEETIRTITVSYILFWSGHYTFHTIKETFKLKPFIFFNSCYWIFSSVIRFQEILAIYSRNINELRNLHI